MKKLYRLFIMLMLSTLVVACSDDDDAAPDPGLTTDITAYFDAKFAAKLQERKYIPDAKKILLSDVIDITKVDVSGTYSVNGELTSLVGIEYFKSLTELDCSNNQLTSLDISKNTTLIELDCFTNSLTALDISKNMALIYLDIDYNQFTAIDISKNPGLTYFHCSANQLTSLDVSKNTALFDLFCASNQLSTLDVSKNTSLIYLVFDKNPGFESTFVVKSWFDNNSIPLNNNFTEKDWNYDGRTITIDYQKVSL